ncbi:decaprenyl-phosphate phosphoribosyltransferase [Lipingzhangella sp. LS1_29]|uniref:Decaprenyl-phosphate phosphoribosyltransferase n=1 Tax=Lipingzhangella rawalii TaxID=2055835 RepID=A0ABU2HBJ7_9ACTN|nr:decaprenyl-phosphate phosphoribosyltransferase [Lipingzhangella rawalii]
MRFPTEQLTGLARAARPRQWVKNGLVFAAPLSAGVMPEALGRSLAAFVLFCVAASGTYLLNDVRDRHADREHERKRHRPLASGTLGVPLALATGGTLLGIALTAAYPVGGPWLLAILVGYLGLTSLYTFWLKHLAICDIVAVAGCHVLRALAGAAVAAVPASSWFLIVVSLSALLVVTGKRETELGGTSGHTARSALAAYTVSYLAQVRSMASAAVIVTYCLWALEHHSGAALALHGASIVPFIMAILRYNLLVSRGAGEEPEEIALRDRAMQVFLATLMVLVSLGIYVV